MIKDFKTALINPRIKVVILLIATLQISCSDNSGENNKLTYYNGQIRVDKQYQILYARVYSLPDSVFIEHRIDSNRTEQGSSSIFLNKKNKNYRIDGDTSCVIHNKLIKVETSIRPSGNSYFFYFKIPESMDSIIVDARII